MNVDNEAEKLSIEADKIIHILLKHLMVLKNENAFLKNKAAIHSIEIALPEEMPVLENLPDGIPGKDLGINNDIIGIPGKDLGTNNDIIGIPGKDDGIKNDIIAIPRRDDGIKNVIPPIPRKDVGINNVILGIRGKDLGIKTVLEAFSIIKADGNGGNSIYSVFEDELIKALEHFINNREGQNTIYTFYTDFVEAIETQNADALKRKNDAVIKRLEDTHELPAQIIMNGISIHKLEAALHGLLPRNVRKELYNIVAIELLLLYNSGKVTGPQLRDITGLSVAGFAKHLPKLMKYNFVKKQPPLNYVLTENSIHILLELFGTPKTN
jgi:hypothetical protein